VVREGCTAFRRRELRPDALEGALGAGCNAQATRATCRRGEVLAWIGQDEAGAGAGWWRGDVVHGERCPTRLGGMLNGRAKETHTHTDTHTHTHTAGVAKLGERGEAVVHGSAMVGTQAGRGHVQRRVGTARDSSRGGVAGG
jgi:hypothetical protein